jgi:hypothetical protein
MIAVTANGSILEFVPEELRRNIDIVLAAVKSRGLAIQYASEDLTDSMDVAIAALKQNSGAALYISSRLQQYPIVIGMILNNASRTLASS